MTDSHFSIVDQTIANATTAKPKDTYDFDTLTLRKMSAPAGVR